jgi:hypothetical protein
VGEKASLRQQGQAPEACSQAKGEEKLNRAGFLKCLVAPAAVAVAGPAAKLLDPEGEDMREVDGQLVINGDNVTVQNVSFVTRPAKAAIQVNSDKGTVIRDSIIQAKDA